MPSNSERNKAIVRRFNLEVIEQGNFAVAAELLSKQFVNRTAPPGTPNDAAGILNTFNNILRPAFPDMKVAIHDQIAEGDKVTTRKTVHGTHLGSIMGIPPTGRAVSIDVIDIVRLENDQYIEHWGVNTLAQVLNQLRE